jgi:hypothetical protein
MLSIQTLIKQYQQETTILTQNCVQDFLTFLKHKIDYVLMDNICTIMSVSKCYSQLLIIKYEKKYYTWIFNLSMFDYEMFIYNLGNYIVNDVYEKPHMFHDTSYLLVKNAKQDKLHNYDSFAKYQENKKNISIKEIFHLLQIDYNYWSENKVKQLIGKYNSDQNVLIGNEYLELYDYHYIHEMLCSIATYT